MVDRAGLPLHAAAEPRQPQRFGLLRGRSSTACSPIKRPRGRPRQRPAKVHADKAYDIPRCHAYLRRRGIGDRIARIGIESSERLGRVRWVVERTMAWFTDFRRLDVRYERRDDIHLAFLHLGCALICLRAVERF